MASSKRICICESAGNSDRARIDCYGRNYQAFLQARGRGHKFDTDAFAQCRHIHEIRCEVVSSNSVTEELVETLIVQQFIKKFADIHPSNGAGKATTPASKQTTRHANECRRYGPTVTIGKTVLVSSTGQPLYLTELADYTLVTNCDFTEYIKFAPTSLMEAVRDNWIYVAHVSPTVRMAVTWSTLQARVTGGEILAYQYSEGSIDGNVCVYYGFIPTERQNIADTHKRCLLSGMQVWPRKLYVYLKKEAACTCSPGCSQWSLKLRDHPVRRFCIQQVPWNDIYIMMGDMDKTCVEEIKEARQCPVCAQCLKCANSPVYCRAHRKCRHKTVQTYNHSLMMPLSLPVMKHCRKIRRIK